MESHLVLTLDSPPTALIAAATDLPPGALGAIYDLVLTVPVELSLLAFDDRESARYFDLPIIGMSREVSDLGGKAVELVLKRIAGGALPKEVVDVPFSLVVRQSTARLNDPISEEERG